MTTNITAQIDPAVLAVFPAARLFAVVASPCTKITAPECTPALVPANIAAMPPETIAENPVLASWRQVFVAQGLKPSQFRCSLEALLRRLTKGQSISTSVPAVDLYNAVSVTALAPMGAYDTTKLGTTPIVLRYAQPDHDTFAPIGGKAEDFPITEKVIVYAQGSDVLCWGVNHRDSDTSRVDATSDEVVFFAEGLTAEQVQNAEVAITQLRAKLQSMGVTVGEVLATSGAASMMAQAA